MIGVDKIQAIRSRWRRGDSVSEIAREVKVSRDTVRKYVEVEDLSPQPPVEGKATQRRRTVLTEEHETAIDGWLEEDRRCWHKQRHTAVRVYQRLRDEMGYEGSYSTVQRYVRERKDEMAERDGLRERGGFLLLEWLAGECQVDFGQADFRVRGTVVRGHYLVVSFPHSNVALAQVFWGETSECVCQGLRSVFEYVGGVPVRAVFDNATEVGRRVCDKIVLSSMFRLFAAHYGLSYSFTNPYSGNEKGNVENAVGTIRRNAFVPVPALSDVEAFNERLLGDCLALSDKYHYRKGVPQLELFEEDKAALLELPAKGFDCVAWETRRCDAQGTFTVDGDHRYNAGPAMAGRRAAVGLRAFSVQVVDPSTGEEVVSYEREWGDEPTDSANPVLQLKLLCMRPGGWRDSVVRSSLPEDLVAFIDGSAGDRAALSRNLRTLRDGASEWGWGVAVEAMGVALAETGSLDPACVAVAAARAESGYARVEYDDEVDLSGYDDAFRLLEGGGSDGVA